MSNNQKIASPVFIMKELRDRLGSDGMKAFQEAAKNYALDNYHIYKFDESDPTLNIALIYEDFADGILNNDKRMWSYLKKELSTFGAKTADIIEHVHDPLGGYYIGQRLRLGLGNPHYCVITDFGTKLELIHKYPNILDYMDDNHLSSYHDTTPCAYLIDPKNIRAHMLWSITDLDSWWKKVASLKFADIFEHMSKYHQDEEGYYHFYEPLLASEIPQEFQEKLCDKYRDRETNYEWWDDDLEYWKEQLSERGFEDAEIHFSGFSNQGDGCSFSARVDVAKYLAYYKLRNTYRRINRDAGNVSARLSESTRGYQISVSVEYYGERTDIDNELNAFEENVLSNAEDMASTIYKSLEQQYEYLTSDEAIIENLDANEHKFIIDPDDPDKVIEAESKHTNPNIHFGDIIEAFKDQYPQIGQRYVHSNNSDIDNNRFGFIIDDIGTYKDLKVRYPFAVPDYNIPISSDSKETYVVYHMGISYWILDISMFNKKFTQMSKTADIIEHMPDPNSIIVGRTYLARHSAAVTASPLELGKYKELRAKHPMAHYTWDADAANSINEDCVYYRKDYPVFNPDRMQPAIIKTTEFVIDSINGFKNEYLVTFKTADIFEHMQEPRIGNYYKTRDPYSSDTAPRLVKAVGTYNELKQQFPDSHRAFEISLVSDDQCAVWEIVEDVPQRLIYIGLVDRFLLNFQKMNKPLTASSKNSIFVYFKCPPGAAKKYHHIDDLNNDLHITICYLNDTKYSSKDKQAILDKLATVAKAYEKMDISLTGMGIMNNGDNTSVVLADIPDGALLYHDIEEALTQVLGEYHKDHGFLPHMTIQTDGSGETSMDDFKEYKWVAKDFCVKFDGRNGENHTIVFGTGKCSSVIEKTGDILNAMYPSHPWRVGTHVKIINKTDTISGLNYEDFNMYHPDFKTGYIVEVIRDNGDILYVVDRTRHDDDDTGWYFNPSDLEYISAPTFASLRFADILEAMNHPEHPYPLGTYVRVLKKSVGDDDCLLLHEGYGYITGHKKDYQYEPDNGQNGYYIVDHKMNDHHHGYFFAKDDVEYVAPPKVSSLRFGDILEHMENQFNPLKPGDNFYLKNTTRENRVTFVGTKKELFETYHAEIYNNDYVFDILPDEQVVLFYDRDGYYIWKLSDIINDIDIVSTSSLKQSDILEHMYNDRGVIIGGDYYHKNESRVPQLVRTVVDIGNYKDMKIKYPIHKVLYNEIRQLEPRETVVVYAWKNEDHASSFDTKYRIMPIDWFLENFYPYRFGTAMKFSDIMLDFMPTFENPKGDPSFINAVNKYKAMNRSTSDGKPGELYLRNYGSNLTVRYDTYDNSLVFRYHSTDIVSLYPDKIVLRTGGWNTKTTGEKITNILDGWTLLNVVLQRRYTQNDPHSQDLYLRINGTHYKLFDGMETDYDGNVTNGTPIEKVPRRYTGALKQADILEHMQNYHGGFSIGDKIALVDKGDNDDRVIIDFGTKEELIDKYPYANSGIVEYLSSGTPCVIYMNNSFLHSSYIVDMTEFKENFEKASPIKFADILLSFHDKEYYKGIIDQIDKSSKPIELSPRYEDVDEVSENPGFNINDPNLSAEDRDEQLGYEKYVLEETYQRTEENRLSDEYEKVMSSYAKDHDWEYLSNTQELEYAEICIAKRFATGIATITIDGRSYDYDTISDIDVSTMSYFSSDQFFKYDELFTEDWVIENMKENMSHPYDSELSDPMSYLSHLIYNANREMNHDLNEKGTAAFGWALNAMIEYDQTEKPYNEATFRAPGHYPFAEPMPDPDQLDMFTNKTEQERFPERYTSIRFSDILEHWNRDREFHIGDRIVPMWTDTKEENPTSREIVDFGTKQELLEKYPHAYHIAEIYRSRDNTKCVVFLNNTNSNRYLWTLREFKKCWKKLSLLTSSIKFADIFEHMQFAGIEIGKRYVMQSFTKKVDYYETVLDIGTKESIVAKYPRAYNQMGKAYIDGIKPQDFVVYFKTTYKNDDEFNQYIWRLEDFKDQTIPYVPKNRQQLGAAYPGKRSGFVGWLAPNGKEYSIDRYATHAKLAEAIVMELYPYETEDFNELDRSLLAYYYLLDRGWARIVYGDISIASLKGGTRSSIIEYVSSLVPTKHVTIEDKHSRILFNGDASQALEQLATRKGMIRFGDIFEAMNNIEDSDPYPAFVCKTCGVNLMSEESKANHLDTHPDHDVISTEYDEQPLSSNRHDENWNPLSEAYVFMTPGTVWEVGRLDAGDIKQWKIIGQQHDFRNNTFTLHIRIGDQNYVVHTPKQHEELYEAKQVITTQASVKKADILSVVNDNVVGYGQNYKIMRATTMWFILKQELKHNPEFAYVKEKYGTYTNAIDNVRCVIHYHDTRSSGDYFVGAYLDNKLIKQYQVYKGDIDQLYKVSSVAVPIRDQLDYPNFANIKQSDIFNAMNAPKHPWKPGTVVKVIDKTKGDLSLKPQFVGEIGTVLAHFSSENKYGVYNFPYKSGMFYFAPSDLEFVSAPKEASNQLNIKFSDHENLYNQNYYLAPYSDLWKQIEYHLTYKLHNKSIIDMYGSVLNLLKHLIGKVVFDTDNQITIEIYEDTKNTHLFTFKLYPTEFIRDFILKDSSIKTADIFEAMNNNSKKHLFKLGDHVRLKMSQIDLFEMFLSFEADRNENLAQWAVDMQNATGKIIRIIDAEKESNVQYKIKFDNINIQDFINRNPSAISWYFEKELEPINNVYGSLKFGDILEHMADPADIKIHDLVKIIADPQKIYNDLIHIGVNENQYIAGIADEMSGAYGHVENIIDSDDPSDYLYQISFNKTKLYEFVQSQNLQTNWFIRTDIELVTPHRSNIDFKHIKESDWNAYLLNRPHTTENFFKYAKPSQIWMYKRPKSGSDGEFVKRFVKIKSVNHLLNKVDGYFGYSIDETNNCLESSGFPTEDNWQDITYITYEN